MKSLFPEMEKELREDRKAERREKVQLARTRLKSRDFVWLINHLLERGPDSEHNLMLDAPDRVNDMNSALSVSLEVLLNLYDLWIVGKLWRKPLGIHPGSGEQSYLYGIRGVHKQPEARKHATRHQ